MLLPHFELHRPTQLDEALDILAAHDEEGALIYMGGTELLLVMKLGLASPGHLVDAKGLAELRGLEVGRNLITIGAGTTHRELELDPTLRQTVPAIAGMAREVANVRVRNVGTIGGNLCFAEPHSDPAALFIALDAVVQLVSPHRAREVALENFFVGPLMTVLEPSEMMLRVQLERPPEGAGVVYRRLAFRERPVVSVAAVAADALNLVVGAVGAAPSRIGPRLPVPNTPQEIQDVAALAGDTVEPIADADGSVDYKRHLTRVLVERALTDLERSA